MCVTEFRRLCQASEFRYGEENRGEYEKFRENLIFEIGIDEVENLENLRNKPCGSQFIRDEEIRFKKTISRIKTCARSVTQLLIDSRLGAHKEK